MNTCRELMTTEPECCEASISADMLAHTMLTRNIGSILIVESMDSMRLIGIVTDRDIAVRLVAQRLDATRTPAEKLMSHFPVHCQVNDGIDRVMALMEQYQVRRIPVVDEGGKLVGLISQGDIATRLHQPDRVAEVLEIISQPGARRIA